MIKYEQLSWPQLTKAKFLVLVKQTKLDDKIFSNAIPGPNHFKIKFLEVWYFSSSMNNEGKRKLFIKAIALKLDVH